MQVSWQTVPTVGAATRKLCGP